MKNSEQPITATLRYDTLSGKPNGFYEGLTKLEYASIMAMQSLITKSDGLNTGPDVIAQQSIQYATELLTQLEQK